MTGVQRVAALLCSARSTCAWRTRRPTRSRHAGCCFARRAGGRRRCAGSRRASSARGKAACTSGSNGCCRARPADGLLVISPVRRRAWARQQVCTLHDAAVFDRPEAYTPLFRRPGIAGCSAASRGRPWRLNTVSAFSRARLVERLGVPGERINVIPNGGDHLLHVQADPGYLDSVGLAGRRFVLAVGSENVTKNFAAADRGDGRRSPTMTCPW